MNRAFPQWRKNRYLTSDSLAHEMGFKLLVGGHYRTYRIIHSLRKK